MIFILLFFNHISYICDKKNYMYLVSFNSNYIVLFFIFFPFIFIRDDKTDQPNPFLSILRFDLQSTSQTDPS